MLVKTNFKKEAWTSSGRTETCLGPCPPVNSRRNADSSGLIADLWGSRTLEDKNGQREAPLGSACRRVKVSPIQDNENLVEKKKFLWPDPQRWNTQ
jgi:hypothetical protein